MTFTPIVASAHFLAVAYYTEKHADASFAECQAFADTNSDAFLADASAPMGRHLTRRSTRRGRRDFLQAMRRIRQAARQ
ncbi:MAG TPA: hypothetical protein VMR25_22115 [Planctomycetaceae bacterium]|nr:hypothetical protein [Planctomycetaceae bacterium]